MNETPDWVPDWMPEEQSLSYVQKALATSFLIVASGYIAYHVLFGQGRAAIDATLTKAGSSGTG